MTTLIKRGSSQSETTTKPERASKRFCGRYELKYTIGSGGMSDVRAAYDHLLERSVAIKTLRSHLDDPASIERLRREAAAMARVESPNVVPIYDIGIADEGVYLVMQHLHGMTLAEEVARFGRLRAGRACRIMADILAGVSALHVHGLVHRDLKPSNIMLDRDDRAILLDLGITLNRRKRPLTPPGMTPGTLGFMAPEQRCTGMVDGRADLYQLGRILVFLLTAIEDEVSLLDALRRMPPALAAVARRAMAPIAQRYTSTQQMGEALATAAASIAEPAPLPVPAPAPAPVRAPQPAPRRPWSKWPVLTLAPR